MGAEPVVEVSKGTLRGTSAEGIDRFLGIPYASPPFGERRFALPHPVRPWAGERDAASFGPTAPQAPYPPASAVYLPTVEIPGDDILTVNVWAPSPDRRDGPLPVLVFVHGGALTRGAAALPLYDGAAFARDGVVFVSVQYRLGAEGFSVLDDVPLDLGVHDVIAALRWVREEIAAFGGDRGRVTAVGQSAGANVLAAIFARPNAPALFDRIALQSGPLSARPRAKAARMTRRIARSLGIAATREEFSARTPADLVAAQAEIAAKGTPLGGAPSVALAIGDDAVPVSPIDALLAGAGNGIPLLIGSTLDEYRLWFVPGGLTARIRPTALLLARLASRVPRRIARAHKRRDPAASPGDVLGRIVGDMLLRGPLTALADARLAGPAKTWVYEFRWRSPVDGLGAAHAMELGFVFDTLAIFDAIALTGPDAPQSLADEMHRAWVSFAVDGDPGWTAWTAARPVQAFDADGSHLDHAPRADELDGLPRR